ncbi:hypothetical protein F4776DRAFT_628263 [Hypoxylon sp. NC0597]|nr:hypothetical protein F4776DRAFT_628263 [Hypoxylon sp. NC0597]
MGSKAIPYALNRQSRSQNSPLVLERSGAYACSPRRRIFVFSIRRKLPFYFHCPLCGSLTMARVFLESRALPTREPRNPLLSMNMPSTRIHGHAKRITPFYGKREKNLGRLPKGKYGYIEREIVIVVKVLCCHRLKCSTSLLSDEYLRAFFLVKVRV